MNKPNVDFKDAKHLKCPKCGGNLFGIAYRILGISKLLPANATGKDIIQPVPCFKCENKKCGHVLKKIRPA